MPSKMFIINYNGKHKVHDWKACSTQGDKGEADSHTYCTEIKETSTCSLHTLNSKGRKVPASVLYISNIWDFIYCRDERSTRWTLNGFRWRSFTKKKTNRNRVIATAHLFTRTIKGKMQSFAYVMVTGKTLKGHTRQHTKSCSECCYFKKSPVPARNLFTTYTFQYTFYVMICISCKFKQIESQTLTKKFFVALFRFAYLATSPCLLCSL